MVDDAGFYEWLVEPTIDSKGEAVLTNIFEKVEPSHIHIQRSIALYQMRHSLKRLTDDDVNIIVSDVHHWYEKLNKRSVDSI